MQKKNLLNFYHLNVNIIKTLGSNQKIMHFSVHEAFSGVSSFVITELLV